MVSENNVLEKQTNKNQDQNDLIKTAVKQFNFNSITPEEIVGRSYQSEFCNFYFLFTISS